MEDVTLALSAAALAVSGLALWLSTLRPAVITLEPIGSASAVALAGVWPNTASFPPGQVEIAISVWNSGAQGGVLERVDLELAPNPAWGGVSFGGAMKGGPGRQIVSLDLPRSFEAGETETYYLEAALTRDPSLSTVADFAAALHKTDCLHFTIPFRYRRARRIGSGLESRTGAASIELETSGFVDNVVLIWDQRNDPHLVDAARNGTRSHGDGAES